MKSTKRRSGLTLIEVLLAIAIFGGLAVITVSNFVKAREQAQLNTIVTNLRVIDGAKDLWALSNKKSVGAMPAPKDIAPYMHRHVFPPTSVVGETYHVNPIGVPPTAVTPKKLRKYKAGSRVEIP